MALDYSGIPYVPAPMTQAAIDGDLPEVKRLYAAGHGFYPPDDDDPFYEAASRGFYDIAAFMIGTGKIKINFAKGYALYWATQNKHVSVMHLIIANGGDLFVSKDNKFNTWDEKTAIAFFSPWYVLNYPNNARKVWNMLPEKAKTKKSFRHLQRLRSIVYIRKTQERARVA